MIYKTLVVVGNFNQEIKLEKNTLYVCFDWITFQKLKKLKFNVIAYDEFITKKEGRKLDEFLLQLRKTWYVYDEIDLTNIYGYSPGQAFSWTMWWKTFIPKYKFLLAFHMIFEKYKSIEKVIISDNFCDTDYSDIIRLVSKMNNKKVYCLHAIGQVYTFNILGGTVNGWRSSNSAYANEIFKFINNCFSTSHCSKKVLMSYHHIFDNVLLDYSRFDFNKKFDFVLVSKASNDFLSKSKKIFHILETKQTKSTIDKYVIEKIKLLLDEENYQRKFKYMNYNMFQLLSQDLKKFYFNEMEIIFNQFKSFEQQIHGKIHCILVPYDVTIRENVLVQIARKFKIPTVCVLHGYSSVFQNPDNFYVDHFVVYSKSMKSQYERHHKDSNTSVHCFGNPYFDDYVEMKNNVQQNFDLILTHSKEMHTVSCKSFAPEKYIINIVQQYIRKKKKIIVKLHPSESLDYYKQLLVGMIDEKLILRNENIKALVKNCRCLVSDNDTTVILEAMILNKKIKGHAINKKMIGNVDGKSSKKLLCFLDQLVNV